MSVAATEPASVVSSRAKLTALLEALPAVPAGHVRVFRGQTARYPKLLASGHRGARSPRERAWALYGHLVALRLKDAQFVDPREGYTDLEDMLFWLQAIKQHYGPGSPFIDVTHSLDVALWFALNAASSFPVSAHVGSGTTPWVDRFPVRRTWVGFKRVSEFGWLYVLDIPRPSGGPGYEHGTFVDLRVDAPQVYRDSTRIQAQHACLVLANPAVNGGDLSSFGVCEPIAVAAALLDELGPEHNTRSIFPDPDDDPWYARFLETPQAWNLDGGKELPYVLAPALDVTLYAPSAEPQVADIKRLGSRFYVVPPPLALNALTSSADAPPALREALGVLLEGPITIATPPLATGTWNEEALWRGIEGAAWLKDREDESASTAISTDNVFVEFSPLETALWHDYFSEESFEFTRAVWLRQVGDAREVWLVEQGNHKPMEMYGGFRIALDRETRRILIHVDGAGSRSAFLADAPFGKKVFAVLLMLHHLSPTPKISPTAYLINDGRRNLVVKQSAVARLETVGMRSTAAGYVRVRTFIDGDVYLGGGRSLIHEEAWIDAPEGLAKVSFQKLKALFPSQSQ